MVTIVLLLIELPLGWFFFSVFVLSSYPFMVARAAAPMPGLTSTQSDAVIMMVRLVLQNWYLPWYCGRQTQSSSMWSLMVLSIRVRHCEPHIQCSSFQFALHGSHITFHFRGHAGVLGSMGYWNTHSGRALLLPSSNAQVSGVVCHAHLPRGSAVMRLFRCSSVEFGCSGTSRRSTQLPIPIPECKSHCSPGQLHLQSPPKCVLVLHAAQFF